MPLTAQVTSIVLLMGILSVHGRGKGVAHPASSNTHTANDQADASAERR